MIANLRRKIESINLTMSLRLTLNLECDKCLGLAVPNLHIQIALSWIAILECLNHSTSKLYSYVNFGLDTVCPFMEVYI